MLANMAMVLHQSTPWAPTSAYCFLLRQGLGGIGVAQVIGFLTLTTWQMGTEHLALAQLGPVVSMWGTTQQMRAFPLCLSNVTTDSIGLASSPPADAPEDCLESPLAALLSTNTYARLVEAVSQGLVSSAGAVLLSSLPPQLSPC